MIKESSRPSALDAPQRERKREAESTESADPSEQQRLQMEAKQSSGSTPLNEYLKGVYCKSWSLIVHDI